MKHILLATLLVTALAGCSEPVADDAVLPEPVVTDQNTTVGALVLSSPAALTTRDSTATLQGTVTPGAIVSVTYGSGAAATVEVVNDTWTTVFEVPPGHTVATITADDGAQTSQRSVTIIREVEVTVGVVYRGDVGLADHEDTFWMDLGALASQATGAYEGCEQGHPGTPNVHDALVAWEGASAHAVGYSDCGSFGVGVNDINGHASPGYWCFTVNGEAAETGITLAALAAGDVIVWDDCALVLG